MTIEEAIVLHIRKMPEPLQREVLDFVEYLESKDAPEGSDESACSLSYAMRGMEDEESPFSVEDLKEVFS